MSRGATYPQSYNAHMYSVIILTGFLKGRKYVSIRKQMNLNMKQSGKKEIN